MLKCIHALIIGTLLISGMAHADSFLTSPESSQAMNRTARTAKSALNFLKNNRSGRRSVNAAIKFDLVRDMNNHGTPGVNGQFLKGLQKMASKRGAINHQTRLLYHSIKLREAENKSQLRYRLKKITALCNSAELLKSASAQTLLGTSIAYADQRLNAHPSAVVTPLKVLAAKHLDQAQSIMKTKAAMGASPSQQGAYMHSEVKAYAKWYEGYNTLLTGN